MNTLLDGLPDDMILCGRAETTAAAPVRRENAFLRFISSPTAAVILSVCIAFGVVFAIIMAGRGDGGKPVVPLGATEATGTEPSGETDAESAAETEAFSEPETELIAGVMELVPSYEIARIPAGTLWTQMPEPDALEVQKDVFPVGLLPGDELLFSLSVLKSGEPFVPDSITLSVRPHDGGEAWSESALQTGPDGRVLVCVPDDAAPGGYDLYADIPEGGDVPGVRQVVFGQFLTVGADGGQSLYAEEIYGSYFDDDRHIYVTLFLKNTGAPMTLVCRDGSIGSIGHYSAVNTRPNPPVSLDTAYTLTGDARCIRLETGCCCQVTFMVQPPEDGTYPVGEYGVIARLGNTSRECPTAFKSYPESEPRLYGYGSPSMIDRNRQLTDIITAVYTGQCRPVENTMAGWYGEALFEVVHVYRGEVLSESMPEQIWVTVDPFDSDLKEPFEADMLKFEAGKTYLLPITHSVGLSPVSSQPITYETYQYMGTDKMIPTLRVGQDGSVDPALNGCLTGFVIGDDTTVDEVGEYLASALAGNERIHTYNVD